MHSQLSLWETKDPVPSEVGQSLAIPDAEVIWFPNAFSFEESCQLYQELLETVAWKQESIVLFNREVAIPRLTAWYGESGKSYTY